MINIQALIIYVMQITPSKIISNCFFPIEKRIIKPQQNSESIKILVEGKIYSTVKTGKKVMSITKFQANPLKCMKINQFNLFSISNLHRAIKTFIKLMKLQKKMTRILLSMT